MSGATGLVGVVSPYHLTTREPACMAALLLAARCVTLIPVPPAPGAQGLARSVPRFVEMMETWRWSTPMWSAGVLASAFEGVDAAADVWAARAAMASDAALAPVRDVAGVVSTGVEADPRRLLDAIARDVLRAGPDPAISLPVAAGLDAFGARHGLVVFRSHAQSLAQQAEQALARPVCSIGLPMLTQASAARMLEARAALDPELAALGSALAAALTHAGGAAAARTVRDAARSYARAFDASWPELGRPEDDDDLPRVRSGEVALSLVTLPHDAVLRSACAAAERALAVSRDRAGPAPGSAAPHALTAERPVLACIVRPMGR